MVMQSGLSSCRREMFPAGLRVLVVDDDLPWLKILERMLKKCSYEVTTCALAREALRLLRDRKDGFDIVISDVNMPDMDGFKLLEHVGLEMDLPVIMMSVDGETSRVMKGVQHGACDYLLKPIRMKELKNIWQHVIRKKMHDVRDIEGFEDRDDGYYGSDQILIKKRKDVENKHDEKDSSDLSSSKKARVVWTVELHQKFVKAVNQIGIESDKIGPKKILDLMNVAWLTRENVASHLQKYRLYLSRIREEGETDSFVGMKSTDHSSSGSLSVHDSTLGQQNDVSSNHISQGNQLPFTDSKPIDADLKISKVSTARKIFHSEITDPDKASFGASEGSISYVGFDSAVSSQYPWTAEAREMQLEEPAGGVVQSHDIPGITHAHGPSISETDQPLTGLTTINGKLDGNDVRQLSPIERALLSFSAPDPEPFGCVLDMKHRNSSHDSGRIKVEAPLEGSIESFNVYPKSHTSNLQHLEPNFQVAFTQVSCQFDQSSSSVIGWESTLGLPGEDLMSYWLQNDSGTLKDVSFDYAAPSYSNGPKVGLDYDSLFDFVEYPVDQGLTWV